MNSLVELFCAADDFCLVFEPQWQSQLLASGQVQRRRARQLCLNEIMTFVILFHQSHYRHFKAFYTEYVLIHLGSMLNIV